MKRAMYVKALTIALPQEIYSSIKRLSDERIISMAQVVREILEETLSQITLADTFNEAVGTKRSATDKEDRNG